MTLRYEINPPKVIQDTILSHEELQCSLNSLRQRVFQIGTVCNGIHLTDSVLGIPRISPITSGALIRDDNKKIDITASLRIRDKNLTSLTQTICDAVLLGLNGVLVIKGDEPPKGPKDSGLISSQIVKYFKEMGFDKKIDIFLSLPNNPNFNKIQKKIEAEPTGFITQVIHSEDQVSRIVDELKPQGFKIIPCILLPFEKNAKSAQFLNLDWSSYKESVVEFIKKIHEITGDVLITSPNDFKGAQETLKKLEI